MRRVALLALAVTLPVVSPLGLLSLPASAAPAAGSELAERLDAALATRALRGAQLAVLVVSRDDGRELYARNADRVLIPASNQKILTALASLSSFGPAHRFETTLLAPSPPDAEGVVPALAVRGGGDPTLTSEEWWRLAADLRRAGVRRVEGGLLLDDSAFDTERWHPAWGRISARAYHSPVGALSANYGALAVVVGPGPEAGSPLSVFVDPPAPGLRIANRARTGPASARAAIQVDRALRDGALRVLVSGSLPLGSDARTLYRSVPDPLHYAEAVLRMQLAAVGIEVGAETRVGHVPASWQPLLAYEGQPLAEIVRRFLKYSNNTMAESLLKSLGARASGPPGTWPKGVAALRAEIASLGIDTEGLVLVDGSGLAYGNRISPRALVGALRVAERSFRFGPELLAALPIAAADGTLEERASAAADVVRAKTGLLTRVTGLSGLARRESGEVVIFSVLVNGFRSRAESAMAAVDAFVAALVRSGGTPP